MFVGPAGRPRGSRPAPATSVKLVDLPGEVLDRIVRFALAPPSQSRATTLLLICRTLRARAAPLVYARVDLSRLDAPASLEFALRLDPHFSLRLDDYTLAKTLRHRTLPSNPPRAFYPIDPDNALDLSSSTAGASLRLHLRHLEIYSRWDTTGPLSHSWYSAFRGVPFTAVPVLLDVVRRSAPNLRSLRLDLPKSTQVAQAYQAQTGHISDTILGCLGRYGTLEVLVIDAWEIPSSGDVGMTDILERCLSLQVFTLSRALLSDRVFHPASTSLRYGIALRRLTLIDTAIPFAFIISVLKTFLSLESLKLTAYTDPGRDPPLRTFVERSDPFGRPRFEGGATFAPNLRSFVLRPSYSYPIIPTEDRIVRLVALLLAVSPSLRRLHLGVHFAETTCLLPLLSGAFERLELLRIGFISAQDEVGDGARLTRADDARGRPGVLRGVDVEGDRDPLDPGTAGPRTPTPARSRFLSERVVLGRLRLDDELVRQLVDPHLAQTWPPTRMSAHRRLVSLLAPFPRLTHFLNKTRTCTLRELHIFERDYVEAFLRRRAAEGADGARWIAPGVRAPDPGDQAWKWLMEGQQGI